MIAVIDYGAGNIFSLINALKYIGEPFLLAQSKKDLDRCDKIILPGVGAFKNAIKKLQKQNLFDCLKEQARVKPFLGICLGMQLLFEESFEFGHTEGLALIRGSVVKLSVKLKVPHMGWNAIEFDKPDCPMLNGIENGSYYYFVHSYAAETQPQYVAAHCRHGIDIPALVWKDNIFGAQFHPEKSGDIGIKMLKNFCAL